MKRTMSICLMIIMLLTTIVPASFAEINQFNEANYEGHWALEKAEAFRNAGLFDGIQGSVELDRQITRAEVVTLMNNAMGYPMEMKGGFTDVYGDHPYYSEIAAAKAAGYINGYQDGSFKPEGQISRQELAVILKNTLLLESKEDNILRRFTDVASIPTWSKDAIEAVVEKGIMNGYPDGSCRVANSITFAESITMIQNAVGRVLNVAKEYNTTDLGTTVTGNLTINIADVTLKDVTVEGNLILAPGIGDGDVLLDNVTVKGETLVAGGGENSIIFRNTTLTTVIVYKKNGKVRVVAEGDTKIEKTQVRGQAKLESKTNGDNGFENIEIIVLQPGQSVELEGDFKKVSVETEVKVEVTGDTVIKDFVVKEDAKGSEIQLGDGTKIEKADLPKDTVVDGEGTIDKKVVDGEKN